MADVVDFSPYKDDFVAVKFADKGEPWFCIFFNEVKFIQMLIAPC